MKAEPYNFHKPGPLGADLQDDVRSWLKNGCVLAGQRWARHLSFPAELQLQSLETAHPGESLVALSDTDVGYQVAIDPEGLLTLMVFPRRLLLALVGGMLGDSGSELPEDRERTPVEEALCECLLGDVLTTLEEAWFLAEPVKMRLVQAEPHPKRSRILAPDQNLAVCTIAVTGAFGQQAWQWLVPREGLQRRFAQGRTGAQPRLSARSQWELLAQELPVEVSVQLGTVDLPISQLTHLRAGDLVILDQRVSDPLIARVAGKDKYRVWPGRVGSKQAFEVASLIDE